MTTPTPTTELIQGLAEDLAPTVHQIESSPETTQHHYGEYGALIARVANGDKLKALIIGLALIKAGANPDGVRSGLKNFI